MAPHMRCRTAKGEAPRGQPCSRASVCLLKTQEDLTQEDFEQEDFEQEDFEQEDLTPEDFEQEDLEHSPGGARAGHASLMRPNRPLPTLPFVKSAATPRPEQCRGGPGGLGNPGASRLPFGLIARVTRSRTSDFARPKIL
jgi:hypothetical protein